MVVRYLVALLAVAALATTSILLSRGGAEAAEGQAVYSEFLNVDIRIMENSDFLVTETQQYTFSSGSFHYGYRWLPLTDEGSIHDVAVFEGGRRYVSNPEVRVWIAQGGTAAAEEDNTYAFTTWTEGDRLWIGWYYPPTTEGSRTFQLRYLIRGGLDLSEEWGRLNWKAVFQDRDVDIGSTRVAVHLPNSVFPDELGIASSGVAVERRVLGGKTIEFTTGPIRGNQGLDISITFPRSAITVRARQTGRIAGWTAEKAQVVGDWVSWSAAAIQDWAARSPVWMAAIDWLLAALAVAGFGLGWSWLLSIRRARVAGPTATPPSEATTAPPDDLPPAIVGRLLYGSRSFLGDLFSLAQRGYLSITETREKRWYSVGRDYGLTRGQAVPPYRYQQLLLRLVFHGDQEFRVSQRREFWAVMARRAREEMEEDAMALGLLRKVDAAEARAIGRGARHLLAAGLLGLVIGVIGLGLSLGLHLGWGLPLLMSVVVVFGAAAWHTARAPGVVTRTAQGAVVAAAWRAFGKYMAAVAAGKQPPPDDPACFAEYLPYTLVLGVHSGWAKAFAASANAAPIPSWYLPCIADGGWSVRASSAAESLLISDVVVDFRTMLRRVRGAMGGIEGGWGAAPAAGALR